MTRLLIKKYIRSRGLMAGIALLFLTGFVSIHIGKVYLDRQKETIAFTAAAQQQQMEENLSHADGGIGLLLYYLRFGMANEVSAVSALSIGNRDIRVPAQLINIRNLEEQKNTHELINPYYQLLGNMDLSFVIIYLFPLLIIGLGYNLLSEEKESGTWRLIASQSDRGMSVLRQKVWIRLVSILLVLYALLAVAVGYLGIPLDGYFLSYVMISTLYVAFWFALIWFVMSYDLSSDQNALALLSTWILLTIVIPTLLSSLVTTLYPIPETYSTTVDSREGYHSKWDLPKEPTIKKFKEIYPQYSEYEHPEGQDFGWFWYYAMQHLGDVEAADAAQITERKLLSRIKISKIMGYVIPSIHTQLSLNELAKTDLTNQVKYHRALRTFHEDKRLHFYPKIFNDEPIENENWEAIKMASYQDDRPVDWTDKLPLLLICVIILWLAHSNWPQPHKTI